METKSNYYSVEKSAGVPIIYMYDYIGDDGFWNESGTDTRDIKVVKEIRDAVETHGELHIRINSWGGSTKHGAAIITTILQYQDEIHCYNDGVAYSIAAEILLAAKKENRHIPSTSMTMLHGASGWMDGTAKEHRDYADYLDKISGTNAKYLSKAMGLTEADFIEKFYDGKDHYLTSDDCITYGLIDEAADYEAEGIPNTVDKRNYDAVQSYFKSKTSKSHSTKKSYFRFFNRKEKEVQTPAPAIKELDMSKIEDVKKALESGELNPEDLTKMLEEKEASKPITKADVQKMLADEFKALKATLVTATEKAVKEEDTKKVEDSEIQKQIKDLESQLEALKKSDGGSFTTAISHKEGDEKKEVSKFHKKDNPFNLQASKDLGLD